MRLDSILPKNRICTKKEAKVAIRKGFVTVDGIIVKKSSTNVIETNIVCYKGKELLFPTKNNMFKYIMMNKPIGVLSDKKGEDTVYPTFDDLIMETALKSSINPAGRLDLNSIGLLLLTDNGQLNHNITHPKKDITKEYIVTSRDKLDEDALYLIKGGMKLYDGTLIKPIEIEEIEDKVYKMTLTEGKMHIIKKIFKTFGNWIEELKRVSIGPLTLDDSLKPGDYRELTVNEVNNLLGLFSA